MRWLSAAIGPARVDLSEDSAFLLELLDQTHAWRERLVQELRFGSRTHVRAISSYQIDFPPEMLARYANTRRTRAANLLVPLTTRDKAPLLNFTLAGPGGRPAALTSRASTAALQAQYLERLAATSGASEQIAANVGAELYEAIGVFTPGLYRDTFLKKAEGYVAEALRDYLAVGTKLPIRSSDIVRWRRHTGEAARILVDALEESADDLSSSEQLLLAIPRVDPLPRSIADIDGIVEGYLAAVQAARATGDSRFLSALAEYGRRYELIVEVELPLLEPATIKVEEDLPLELSRGHWATHRFALGEARSAHLEARTLDPNVEMASFDFRDRQGDAAGWLESVRHTREALSIYSSEAGRPYYAALHLRFKSALYLRATTAVLVLANIAAFAAVMAMRGEDAYVERVAILVVPTTVAATFVLIRDQTTLATRVLARYRAALALVTLVLWVSAVLSVALDGRSEVEAAKTSGAPVNVRQQSLLDRESTLDRRKESDGEERSNGKPADRGGQGP